MGNYNGVKIIRMGKKDGLSESKTSFHGVICQIIYKDGKRVSMSRVNQFTEPSAKDPKKKITISPKGKKSGIKR